MATRAGIDTGDIEEFIKQLRRVEMDLDPALEKVHEEIAQLAEDWARWEAASGGRGSKTRQRQLAMGAIKGKGSAKDVRVAVVKSAGAPWALAAFWGAKRRTGWYADPLKYRTSPRRQFDSWVGNSWETAVAGTGPYAINDALAHHLPEILEKYRDRLFDDVMKQAFPDK